MRPIRLPEPVRRAFQRSSIGLAVAGVAVIVSSVTTLAAIGESGSGGRPDREMTLSAIEDETTTTSSSSPTTTTTSEQPAPIPMTMPADDTNNSIEDQLADHEARIDRLEAPTTTTTTVAAAPTSSTVPKYVPVVEETTTTTTRPAVIRTTTTTAPPSGSWVEVTRFDGVTPGDRTVLFTTGYVRCVRNHTDGEADPETVQWWRQSMNYWKDLCTSWGVNGTTSPVARIAADQTLRIVNTTAGNNWVFGTIVEEYRCNDPRPCPMPAVGSAG